MRIAVSVLALLVCACATSPGVRLERYRGVYSTHFDVIPDETRICAVITNAGPLPVAWVRLRLEAFSQLGEVPGRWTSYWLYPKPVASGQTIAVEFREAPSADQIKLSLSRVGDGSPPRRGRPLRRTRACSEAALQQKLKRERAERSIAEIQLVAIERRNDPARELTLAQGEPPDSLAP